MKKIFTATLGTETNTFASIPTGHQLFEETCLYRKGSYGKNVPMFGAPLAVWRGRAEAKGWQVVESLCAFAMPAGKTVKKVYEAFRDEILADLEAAMPVDGVLLSMHGAMVAEGYDDCESDILAGVRRIVGPDIPVGVELDLHCNIGEGTLRDATALVLFKEYPHIDVPERADDLFTVMEGAIEGRTRPVMAAWDCRMIGVFHTTRQPMRGFVDKLSAMEGKDGVLSLSVAHGFPVVRHQGDEQQGHRHHRRRPAQGRAPGARARPGILRHARGHPAALCLARRGDGARELAQPAQAHGAGRRVGQCRRRCRLGLRPSS